MTEDTVSCDECVTENQTDHVHHFFSSYFSTDLQCHIGHLPTEVRDIVQETGIETIPRKKQKAKWLSEEALQTSVKRREGKRKDMPI